MLGSSIFCRSCSNVASLSVLLSPFCLCSACLRRLEDAAARSLAMEQLTCTSGPNVGANTAACCRFMLQRTESSALSHASRVTEERLRTQFRRKHRAKRKVVSISVHSQVCLRAWQLPSFAPFIVLTQPGSTTKVPI
jgi:hypothetical protein